MRLCELDVQPCLLVRCSCRIWYSISDYKTEPLLSLAHTLLLCDVIIVTIFTPIAVCGLIIFRLRNCLEMATRFSQYGPAARIPVRVEENNLWQWGTSSIIRGSPARSRFPISYYRGVPLWPYTYKSCCISASSQWTTWTLVERVL